MIVALGLYAQPMPQGGKKGLPHSLDAPNK